VPFRTPFPNSNFTSPLPFCLSAICSSFATSFVMGVSVVSAQREVLRFAGMGAACRSKEFTTKHAEWLCCMLMSYTQEIQGDSTVTSLKYARDFMT